MVHDSACLAQVGAAKQGNEHRPCASWSLRRALRATTQQCGTTNAGHTPFAWAAAISAILAFALRRTEHTPDRNTCNIWQKYALLKFDLKKCDRKFIRSKVICRREGDEQLARKTRRCQTRHTAVGRTNTAVARHHKPETRETTRLAHAESVRCELNLRFYQHEGLTHCWPSQWCLGRSL